MPRHHRPKPYKLAIFYSTLAVAWLAFSQWIAPSFILRDPPSPFWAILQRIIVPPPALFLSHDLLTCWRQFSTAVLIVGFLHFTVVLVLRAHDLPSDAQLPSPGSRANRRISLALALLSFAFLALALISGPIQDYYFYLQMWYEVRQGHDPWFLVLGKEGIAPLNAYGPLFNSLAILAWVTPLAPKLLFAYAYILFAIIQIKTFTCTRTVTIRDLFLLAALFWNPFPWIEIAIDGHFDLLVALLCLGAIRYWTRGQDTVSAVSLASGVLLKFLPIVLLPFLAIDQRRIRLRFLALALTTIATGFALSYAIWGPSTLAPLTFAVNRGSILLSIFAYLRGHRSPLHRLFGPENYDYLSPYILLLVLLCEWSWYLRRKPSIEAAAAVATMTIVLLHRTGYPQYHMVPFVLTASWCVKYSSDLARHPRSAIAISSYFAWVAAFAVYYAFANDDHSVLYWNIARSYIAIPAFVVATALILGVIHASTPAQSPDRFP